MSGKSSARSMLREMFSIVVAVLLALAANAMWQARQDRIYTAKVLEGIKLELTENQGKVARALEYHTMLRDTLQLVYADEALFGEFDIFPLWRGAGAPPFESAAYESAKFTGAMTNVDFELASEIATVYGRQEELSVIFNRYFDGFVSTEDPMNRERFIHLVGFMIGDAVRGQEALADHYVSTIELLETQ